MRIDLAPFCGEAGVYTIELARESGAELELQSLDLYDGQGVKLDRFIRRRANRNRQPYYEVTITAEGSAYELLGLARISPAQLSQGWMTITRRSE